MPTVTVVLKLQAPFASNVSTVAMFYYVFLRLYCDNFEQNVNGRCFLLQSSCQVSMLKSCPENFLLSHFLAIYCFYFVLYDELAFYKTNFLFAAAAFV